MVLGLEQRQQWRELLLSRSPERPGRPVPDPGVVVRGRVHEPVVRPGTAPGQGTDQVAHDGMPASVKRLEESVDRVVRTELSQRSSSGTRRGVAAWMPNHPQTMALHA